MTDSVSPRTPDQPYEEYYGLAHSPFTLSPDPRFLYLSESHDDALRALLKALRRKEGFIVLAGDIGTGKTTLCRAVVEQLDRTTFTSLVLNPFVSVEELLRDVLIDFGIASRDAARNGRLAAASRHQLITTLHDFLLSLVPLQGSCVLIIDEAQHLAPDVLEQIRLIANLETSQAKLLQIVLVGQLNLLDTLAAAPMRQLAQRVSVRARLTPLSPTGVAGYVAHRLAVASDSAGTDGTGKDRAATFEPAALNALHRLSGGVPRVINLLCDRALALGAQRGATMIDAATVRDAAAALEITPPEPALDRTTPTTAAEDAWDTPAPVPAEAPLKEATRANAAHRTDTAGADAPATGNERSRRLALGAAATLILVAAITAGIARNIRVMPPAPPPAPTFTLRLPAPIEPLPIPEPAPVLIRRRAPVIPPAESPPPALPPL